MKAKKTILVDGLSLLSPFTGIAKYTYENSSRMVQISNNKFEWYYYYGFYSKNLIQATSSKKNENFLKNLKAIIVSNKILKTITRRLLSLITQISPLEYDLYWQPNFIPAPIKAKRIITTVHDFSFHIRPEWHPKERVQYYKTHFWETVKKSDWIITGSYFSKNEIIKYTGFPEEKITVIYHGVNHDIFKIYDTKLLEDTKNKFELENFILFVGSIEPRKNLLNLLKAYHLLPKKIKEKYNLVLVGLKGWENSNIINEIKKEKKNIKYIGYLTDIELAYVYNLASLFVYPSLYEGFGIPPLEAMACGTPVIASNTASLPESCGNAAILVNPYNPKELSEKISLLLKDKQTRETLIKKGIEHAKLFTWEKSAKKHLETFEKVMSL